ncbi:MAG: family 20 glycosylhydrolase [Armatimonadota bacterium]
MENTFASVVTPGLPWKMRAVQLDLARQRETVDYIRRFIDFSAAQGFNTLALYLEGVVNTPSFHSRPPDASYTLDQMADVMRHAQDAGIDIVPVINTLGHAAHFFSGPELRHLAEERDGHTRFGGAYLSTFCPSLRETYDFLERYLAELAEVFTGLNFHIGCDEAWNMGFCHLCAERWQREGLANVFTAHLQRIVEIGRRLGKRLWMWDDMYELFPDKLEQAPRDVVLCHWQYDPVVEAEGIQAHFLNRRRRDWLAEYARLGIDAVICPTNTLENINTFTDYGRRYPVLGGLLTQWVEAVSLNTELTSLIAYTGRLWSGGEYAPERIWAESVSAVVPEATEALTTAIHALSSAPRRLPPTRPQAYLRGPVPYNERLEQQTARLALGALRQARNETPAPAASAVLDDLEMLARLNLLYGDLRALLPQIFDPRRLDSDLPRLQRMANACRQELAALQGRLDGLHEQRHSGLDAPYSAAQRLKPVAEGLQPAWDRLARPVGEDDWWLVLRLFLPDAYGAPRMNASIIVDGESQSILEGSFKADYMLGGSYYTVQAPFTAARQPEAVRLEAWGHGGQGIAYLELQNRIKVSLPQQVRVTSGVVYNPEALLRDDTSWAYFGYPDIATMMETPAIYDDHAVLDVIFG